MTQTRLEQLKELNSKRTKGAWVIDEGCDTPEYPGISLAVIPDGVMWYDSYIVSPSADYEDSGIKRADAEFVTALANNADWLISCVEQLQELRVTYIGELTSHECTLMELGVKVQAEAITCDRLVSPLISLENIENRIGRIKRARAALEQKP